MGRNDLTGFRNRTTPSDLAAPFNAVRPHSGGPAIDRTLQVYLPEIYPIPAATEFNILAQKATTIVEAGVDIGLTVDVPPNNVAIIRGVNLYISDMTTATNVSWTVTLNGAPAQGFNNLSIFPRNSPFVSNSFDAFVRVGQGIKIRVVYTNTDGGSYTVGAALSGWWWPQTLGEQWIRSGGAE